MERLTRGVVVPEQTLTLAGTAMEMKAMIMWLLIAAIAVVAAHWRPQGRNRR